MVEVNRYIPVIGLEIHLQLNLKNKMFCPERFEYGSFNNTLTSPITLAFPGTLPTLNKEAFYSAIKLGLSFGSEITNLNYFDRKCYFYPDLPKGYQITQNETPICRKGKIFFNVENEEKHINLIRIHIEEDTANVKVNNNSDSKIFNNNGDKISIDYNRCGVALLEIVTEPEFRNSNEVYYFLYELRRIVRYLNISNGNMEEGSLRCDVNISLMKENSNTFGKRVEIKNINSIKNVKNAIDFEIKRQSEILNKNQNVIEETRMFVPEDNSTKFMRLKENSLDYHYIREFNIAPVLISNEEIDDIKKILPPLPKEYKKKLINEYKLSDYVASIFLENLDLLYYFNDITKDFKYYEATANWIIGPIKGLLNELKLEINELQLNKNNLCELIKLVIDNKISFTTASQIILRKLIENPEKRTTDIVNELNLTQDLDTESLEIIVNKVLEKYKNKIEEYKSGKKGLLGLFVGEVMKESKNKAKPQTVNELILKTIKDRY